MTTIEELQQQVDQLQVQQATMTGALKLLIEGRWTGPLPTAAAQIDALLGGNVKDFKPLPFPKE